MTRQLTRLLPVTALLLAACGSEQAPDPVADAGPTEAAMAAMRQTADRSMATAYVVHGINGKDLGLPEALPVDVQVGDACAFPGLANGKQAMADLKNGTYEIAIAAAGTTTPVYANTLKLRPGRAYNAYAVGTPSGDTFEVLLQVTRIGRRCDLSRGEAHD